MAFVEAISDLRKMKAVAAIVCLFLISVQASQRTKREAYDLPDGTDILVGPISTTFQCPYNALGYYADVENDCKIFHVCNSVTGEDGLVETRQYSFVCSNQTVFNQLSFTCAHPEESVPCFNAPDFFYLNDNLRLGDPHAPFLTDQDVFRASSYKAPSPKTGHVSPFPIPSFVYRDYDPKIGQVSPSPRPSVVYTETKRGSYKGGHGGYVRTCSRTGKC